MERLFYTISSGYIGDAMRKTTRRKYSSVCDECGKCKLYQKQKCLGLLTYEKVDCCNPSAVKQRRKEERALLESGLDPYEYYKYY